MLCWFLLVAYQINVVGQCPQIESYDFNPMQKNFEFMTISLLHYFSDLEYFSKIRIYSASTFAKGSTV